MRAEDTLQFMADFYKGLFPTRKHALNHLFCTIGNGYEWINGELVEDGEYEKRYKLRKPIKKAIFKNEYHWIKMNQLYTEINRENGIEIPPEYNFRWTLLNKSDSVLFNLPDNIKDDWKALAEECKELMRQDGIDL